MKRIIAILLSVIMSAIIFTACGNTGSISDYPAELEEAGISQEEYAAMSDEQKQAILDELGIKAEIGSDNETQKPTEKPEQVTIADVENGGSYVITVGDRWNYVEMHYVDGNLVSITTHFQKNDEEEPEIETVTGDAIKDYTLYFIDYTQSPSAVVNALQDNGFNGVSIRKAQ